MFESLDQNSPARIPRGQVPEEADRVGRIYLAITGVVSGVLTRQGAGPDSVRSVLSWVLIGFACVGFAVFEYRAYRERKDGPIDMRLDQ